MQRFNQNTNLSLNEQGFFNGMSVQVQRGPLIEEYLVILLKVTNRALNDYGRVLAIRFDLRFPRNGHVGFTNDNLVIERFFASLKAKIRHNRYMAAQNHLQIHDTLVRDVWAREFGQHGIPHYHVVIFLNYYAYNALGKPEIGRDNLFNRIIEAWASALGMSVSDNEGLVEFVNNGVFYLNINDPESLSNFIYASSYICKAATKQYGSGVHNFGFSRV